MNWSLGGLAAEVPPTGMVTRTSTVPAAAAGAVAVMGVAEPTVKPEAAVAPEADPAGPGEVGPGDGDRRAAGGRARGGLTPVTVGGAT